MKEAGKTTGSIAFISPSGNERVFVLQDALNHKDAKGANFFGFFPPPVPPMLERVLRI